MMQLPLSLRARATDAQVLDRPRVAALIAVACAAALALVASPAGGGASLPATGGGLALLGAAAVIAGARLRTARSRRR